MGYGGLMRDLVGATGPEMQTCNEKLNIAQGASEGGEHIPNSACFGHPGEGDMLRGTCAHAGSGGGKAVGESGLHPGLAILDRPTPRKGRLIGHAGYGCGRGGQSRSSVGWRVGLLSLSVMCVAAAFSDLSRVRLRGGGSRSTGGGGARRRNRRRAGRRGGHERDRSGGQRSYAIQQCFAGRG